MSTPKDSTRAARPGAGSGSPSNGSGGLTVAAIAAMPDDSATVTEIVGSALRDGGPLAVVVVPYAPAAKDAPLVRDGLPALPAKPGTILEPNRVYLVPFGRPLVLQKGRFERPSRIDGNGAPEPVPALFTSLGRELRSRVIGVLLSGMCDGATDGLRAIKEHGGTTLVQDPSSSVFDAGPRAAIAAGVADQVLPPDALAKELSRLSGLLARTSDAESSDDVEDATGASPDGPFRRILSLLKSRFQVDLGHYKLTTIRRRVERRMTLSRFDDLASFEAHVRARPEALQELHDELFIHVTQFFRDPTSFRALSKVVFPALLKDRAPSDPIRIWVPGCSTGEEAYSIAMALSEYLEEHEPRTLFQLFATDISDVAVDQARRAVYSADLLRDTSPKRIARFFEEVRDGFKIRKELRERCIISRHDVTTNPPFAKLDLVSCRNVLIYFGADLQKRIVPIFHYALKSGGFLWLGRSETAGASSKLFSVVDKPNKIYRKNPGPQRYLHVATSRLPVEKLPLPGAVSREPKGPSGLHSADQLVLLKYGPPGVVVNHELEIVQFRGRTAPFLQPAVGQPTHGLLKMAHPDLLPALRPLLQSARKQNLSARREGLSVDSGGRRVPVDLEVTVLNPLAPERERHYLVVFEVATPPRARAAPAGREKRPARTSDVYVEQLQQELDGLREYQKTLVEQFESTQEELTSANEELQATNEEFQSTNEELETAKEELQSANEELTTMNDELQGRNAELVAVNEKLARGEDRFRLMVEGVKEYAIYMLDPEGKVTSWNEGARRLTGYEASEVMGEGYSRFFLPEDIAAGAPRLELERARIEGRFEAEGWRIRKDRSRLWVNVVVTRINDSKGTLIGYSKVIRDLTERRRADEELEKSEQRFRLMISGIRDYAIFMLDPEWRVASWNEGARRLKGYDESEILGKDFSVFYTPEDFANGKLEREKQTVLAEGRFEDVGWRVRKDGSRFWASVILTRVTDSRGNLVGFTKVTRDLTEQKRAEDALHKLNESLELRVRERTKDLEQALKARDEFLSIASHELKTPLTGLKLQIQMALRKLERGTSTPERAANTFDRALRQAVALEELVEDLLDVSRIQTGHFVLDLKPVVVSALVEEVVARFADQLTQSKSRIDLHLEPGLTARWDERRMMQVLVNLVSNALKYAPGSPIRISSDGTDGFARLVVEDSGPGISEERQKAIFERFERAGAPPGVGGLGLGLFIARRIVEAHHGRIDVESRVGAGTKFVIEIPRGEDGND